MYLTNGIPVKTTDFVGNFVYENFVPAYAMNTEGRVILNSIGTAYCKEVYLKDHLGNVRVALRRESGVLKVRQVDSYYPFGMNIKGLSVTTTTGIRPNEYLYNGKMMQDEMELNLLDYGARMYDPTLGRFFTIDPMAVFTPGISPYAYADDDPINNIDDYGLGPFTWLKKLIAKILPNTYVYRKDWDILVPINRPHSPSSSESSGNNTETTVTRHTYEDLTPLEPMPARLIETAHNGELKPRALHQSNSNDLGTTNQRKKLTNASKQDPNIKENQYDAPLDEKTLNNLIQTMQDYPEIKKGTNSKGR